MADEVTVTTGVKVQNSVQPKLIIRTENSDIIFTAPYAPKEVSYYITGRKYNEVDRPDRKPITTSSGIALKQMSMELFVGSTNYETSIDSTLAILEQLSGTKQRLICEYDPRTAGLWNITTLDYESVERQSGTNIITRATVNIEFTEAVGFNSKAGTASLVAGSSSSTATSTVTNQPKTYTIKQGDTLAAISQKFFYTPNKWRTIADLNNIDPRNLKVGKVIRIT
jgi:LysM repeat protein